MAPVVPIRLILGLRRRKRGGKALAPYHLDAKGNRVREQLFIKRRGEVGRVQEPEPIGFGDAEK